MTNSASAALGDLAAPAAEHVSFRDVEQSQLAGAWLPGKARSRELKRALRHEAWWGAAEGPVGSQTAPGASHSLRMADVQQEGGPRWVTTVVRPPPGCSAWTASRSSRPSWWLASGSSPSRPRPRWSAAWAAASGPPHTVAARSGCATCPLVAGRWCCGGASASGAVVSRPACGVRTWTARAVAIRPRAVLTERARAEACRRVGTDAHAVAAVARDSGVGWGDHHGGGG
jgi:hypothetical protein